MDTLGAMKWAFVVTIALGACSSVDDVTFPDPLMQVEENGGLVTVSPAQGGYSFTFAAGGQLAMPLEFTTQGTGNRNLFGLNQTCARESLVGISMFPAVAATADPQMGTENFDRSTDFTIESDGPYVVRIHTTYSITYDCPMTEELAGVTDYTLFPDGRIFRHDSNVTPAQHDLTEIAACGCGDATTSGFFFTSFWTFDAQGVTAVGDAMNDLDTCLQYANQGIGMSWSKPAARGVITPSTGPNLIANVFDFIDPTGSPTVSATLDEEVGSVLRIAPDCGQALASTVDPHLLVGTSDIQIDLDGVYVDEATHDAAFTLRARDLNTPMPPFAFVTDVGGHATISIDDNELSPSQVHAQPDGNRTLFYFAEGLAPNSTITIDPQ